VNPVGESSAAYADPANLTPTWKSQPSEAGDFSRIEHADAKMPSAEYPSTTLLISGAVSTPESPAAEDHVKMDLSIDWSYAGPNQNRS